MLRTFDWVRVLVVVDLAVAVLGFLLSTPLLKLIKESEKKESGDSTEDLQARLRKGYGLLILLSLADGILSLVVFHTLSAKTGLEGLDMASKLDKLYSSECFTRQQDKVIFETAETLKSYLGAVVVAQTVLAFADAITHCASIWHKTCEGSLSTAAM
jgi:hypothetical protein